MCVLWGSRLPLELVAEVDLPGAPVRFDYQDIDFTNGHLVIAHMNDDSVDIVNLSDGSLAEELTGIPTARGVAVAPEVGLVFVTSSPIRSSRSTAQRSRRSIGSPLAGPPTALPGTVTTGSWGSPIRATGRCL